VRRLQGNVPALEGPMIGNGIQYSPIVLDGLLCRSDIEFNAELIMSCMNQQSVLPEDQHPALGPEIPDEREKQAFVDL
jgi:hypothetical protein